MMAVDRLLKINYDDETRERMRKAEKYEMDLVSRETNSRLKGRDELAKTLIAMGFDKTKIEEAKALLK